MYRHQPSRFFSLCRIAILAIGFLLLVATAAALFIIPFNWIFFLCCAIPWFLGCFFIYYGLTRSSAQNGKLLGGLLSGIDSGL